MTDRRMEKRDRFLAAVEASPVVMGIINATPDSFHDQGRNNSLEAARAEARRMIDAGAAIVELGAESTRPGATAVSLETELARLEPIFGPVCQELEVAVSIDTYKAQTARFAAGLGAAVINDVWGLQGDADMAYVTADSGCALVVMHNRDRIDPEIDIVEDILRFLERSLQIARDAGIPERHVLLDPGFGFGKTQAQNYAALKGLDRLAIFGRPLLIGLSRKSMIGHVLDVPSEARLIGTLAANTLALAKGARVLRVHDAAEHVETIKIFNAMEAAA